MRTVLFVTKDSFGDYSSFHREIENESDIWDIVQEQSRSGVKVIDTFDAVEDPI